MLESILRQWDVNESMANGLAHAGTAARYP
jgi:hypothetical protein